MKDFIKQDYEYPNVDQLTNMPTDCMYSYVNSTFCAGVANKLELHSRKAYMIARYSIEDTSINTEELSDDDLRLIPFFQNIKDMNLMPYKDWIHTKYGEFAIDDVIITGASDDNYYAVWFDQDVSDSSLIKLSKSHFGSIDEFNQYIVEFFETELHYKIKPIRDPDGWMRW